MENSHIAVLTIPAAEWIEHKALLKKISEQISVFATNEQRELLTPKEVCSMLKINRSTFERLKNTGVLDVVKVNRKKYSKNYVRRQHLENLISEGLV